MSDWVSVARIPTAAITQQRGTSTDHSPVQITCRVAHWSPISTLDLTRIGLVRAVLNGATVWRAEGLGAGACYFTLILN